MLGYDLRNIFFFDHGIENRIRVHNHDRALGAKAVAAGLDDSYFFAQAIFFNFFIKDADQFLTAGGSTSGSTTNQYMGSKHTVYLL